ncbi:MAG: transglutaminase domain-containing protein [Archaeoglobus sp.]|nr:transglutaminase domain-containing protein [Archaeoglobus sp.]
MKEELLEALKKLISLVLILVALSFLLNFTSSLDFSNTGLSGFIGIGAEEISPSETIPPDIQEIEPYKEIKVSVTESIANLHEGFDPPQVPIFFVEGLNKYTNKLRLFTAAEYRDGKWFEEEGNYGDTPAINPTGHVTKYHITPVSEFSKHIPVAKDTAYVTVQAKFNRQTGTYLIESNLSKPYDAASTAWKTEAEFVEDDPRYTQLSFSENDLERIRSLAEEITMDAATDYEKVLAIKEYLEKNYEYDPNYTPPPENVEPVTYFLFENKKGICKEFATSFVALARSIGIPARAVFGYNARPIPDNQTVLAAQAHVWAEVKFTTGWVEIDPTPAPENMQPTITEITYADPTATKGSNFTVRGIVTTKDGLPVYGGYVEISIKRNKNESGLLLGLLKLDRGKFEGKVKVPDVSGKYHVVAHYVGSLRFKESWSDPIITIYSPPEIRVNIPDKLAAGIPYRLGGRIVDYNGSALANAELSLRIDGKVVERAVSDADGFFYFTLKIDEEGRHHVSVEYQGSKFIMPLSESKFVEVGRIELLISNKSAVKGKEWVSSGKIFFKGEPFDEAIITFSKDDFTTQAVADASGNFVVKGKIPENFELGKVPINFTIEGVGFQSSIDLTVKAETEMDVSVKHENDKTYIYVLLREKGKKIPAFGTIRIGDRTAETNNAGLAVFVYDREPSATKAVFDGNEKYLPSEKEFKTSTFPFLVFSILIPLVAYILIKKYRKLTASYIVFEIEREEEDLPLIWDVNEEIKLRVKNLGEGILRVFIDGHAVGSHEKGLEITIAFEEPGLHRILAERVGEKGVLEKEEIEIRIMSYREAIISIFSELVKSLEKTGSVDLSDYTAREILRTFNILNGKEKPEGRKLLRLFELSKYGLREAGRQEFIEAYRSFKVVRGDVIEG